MSQTHCIFCDIAKGRCAAHVVAESRSHIAVLDEAPIRAGQLVVLPKAHHSSFEALPPPLAGGLIRLAQRLAQGMTSALQVDRVAFVITAAQGIHTHAHLVPMRHADDITSAQYFDAPMPARRHPERVPPETLAHLCRTLRNRLEETPCPA